MKRSIGCVVMAAGKSSRFGSNKLLAPLGGKPVLTHVLDSLPYDRLQRVVVVTVRGPVPALCGHVPVRFNESGALSESIRRGIAEMEGLDGCLFVMGDQPLCGRASMERLLDSFQHTPDAIHRLACDGVSGSPVLFPAALFPRLAELEGEAGGMSAARGTGVAVIPVPADHPCEMWDMDTPDALARAEAFLQQNP